MTTTYYIDFGKVLIKLLGTLCLCFAVFFSACEKSTDNGGTAFSLKDNPTGMTVPAEGSSQTFTVQTPGTWKVEPLHDERWLKIEPTAGTGDGTFTVTVDRNNTLEPRESALTFEVDGRIQNIALHINQAPGKQENGNGE